MIQIAPSPPASVLLAQSGLDRPDELAQWIAILSGIAQIVIALALIAIFAAILPLAWNARKIFRRLGTVADRVEERSMPILEHARSVADNVDYVSTAVRADVDQLRETLASTRARLDRVTRLTERRVEQFDAMLEVVQGEAEKLFIGTASTLRGIRAGAEALREPEPEESEEPPMRPRRHL